MNVQSVFKRKDHYEAHMRKCQSKSNETEAIRQPTFLTHNDDGQIIVDFYNDVLLDEGIGNEEEVSVAAQQQEVDGR